MIDISVEDIFELKDKGMTDEQVFEHFIQKYAKIISQNVNEGLKVYYKSIAEKKSQIEEKSKSESRSRRKVDITDEELYELKEQGMSDEDIAEHFTNQGKTISGPGVNYRLKKYYQKLGKERPKAKKKKSIEITDEELYELKEQGMSDKKIAERFTSQGKPISPQRVNVRLKEYYQKLGKERPKAEREI